MNSKFFSALFLLGAFFEVRALADPAPRLAAVDLADFRPGAGVTITPEQRNLRLAWKLPEKEEAVLILNLEPDRPLIDTLGVAGPGGLRAILRQVNPVVLLTIGERDLKHPAGWMAFFDNPPLRPHGTHELTFEKRAVRIASEGMRTIVRIDDVKAGSFRGYFQFTLFANSPLIFAEAVVSTAEDGRAILYDAGLATPTPNTATLSGGIPSWRHMAWLDDAGAVQRTPVDVNRVAGPVAVTRRALAAESDAGTVAVFPPPHQYFYPLDFATNLGFAWFGRSGDQWLRGYGFGVQQPPGGDKRWVPWGNAPPGTQQRLGLFYLVTSGDAAVALAEASRYTRADRFEKLSGHATFSSHYHIEHAVELARKRQELGNPGIIPPELVAPGFVKVFKERGVDIVHLAEFHIGEMPRLPAEKRLSLLKMLHEECARLSDSQLLLLPGEEPNVHLGGHWISLFPKPVYWVLNRAPGHPFTEEVAGYGTVYHVGDSGDVLRLMEQEGGLMWTAHARIKSSRGFPDNYWDRDFYRSGHFLGAAWKSMPLDLSLDRLGMRVLDLQDDMANRGEQKHVLGEVDIFRVERDMETYAHMNINYLRLDRVPRYAEGWQPVLDALRDGRFFVSTGEVLIPEYALGGQESGGTLVLPADGRVELRARLEWTFPLSFAEVVSGDGREVYRQRISLLDTPGFGSRELVVPLELKGRTWVRFEVWDVARNGAFMPPVWLK
jgi:hypothetical protein